MSKKFSRLDILEIILVVLGILIFLEMIANHNRNLQEVLIFVVCLISIVWIEIHSAKTKKE